MKFIGLVFLIIIAIGVIILCSSITKDAGKQQIADVLTIIAMTIGIVLCVNEILDTICDVECRYPTSEYHIETEITTRGNVSDTTYVITKWKKQ